MIPRTLEILLVEDSPGDARLTQEAFREGKVANNMTVVTNGVDALAYLRRQAVPATTALPDLILLDLNLPKMDGRELLAAIKSDGTLKTIPVVVLTTSSSQEDITRAYADHANCYITKPVDLDQFLNVVQSVESFWLELVKLPRAKA